MSLCPLLARVLDEVGARIQHPDVVTMANMLAAVPAAALRRCKIVVSELVGDVLVDFYWKDRDADFLTQLHLAVGRIKGGYWSREFRWGERGFQQQCSMGPISMREIFDSLGTDLTAPACILGGRDAYTLIESSPECKSRTIFYVDDDPRCPQRWHWHDDGTGHWAPLFD